MKKIITFSNFIALLGIMTILFYLIPAVKITANDTSAIEGTLVNLFKATFGGEFVLQFSRTYSATYSLVPCAGLIIAFVAFVIAIILSILKCKNRLATLLATPFYITSGSLVICASGLLAAANNGVTLSQGTKFINVGGTITVAVFGFVLGALSLIDFIGTVAKPKQPTSPAV